MAVNRRVVVRAAPVLSCGLLAVACGSVSGHDTAGPSSTVPAVGKVGSGTGDWRVIRGAPVKSTILIGGQVTFAPPAAWAMPKLDGVQAWDESFLGGDRRKPKPIPADMSYQLGMLTSPPSVTEVLAWGYSSPPGPCIRIGGIPHSGTAAPSASSIPQRCIEWTFIDARDASMVLGTWQPLGTPSPSPSPTPSFVIALQSGGFLGASPERFSPRRLVVQGPLSTIRWTFDNASCSIDMYWFAPPQSQRGPVRATCPWGRGFSVNVVSDFVSRGHVFTVVAGWGPRGYGHLVRAILADGQTQIYDPEGGNGAWLFAVQRCGDYAGTALRTVEVIRFRFIGARVRTGGVIERLPVRAAPYPQPATACRS